MGSSDETPPEDPPADPEDWTDEQWIDWLKRTDVDGAEDGEAARPATALGRMAHTSGGSVLGQAMLGMATAIYGGEQSKVVIVAEGNSEPEDDKPFAVHLDPDHPERSVVVFRAHPSDRAADEGTGTGKA